MSFWRQLRDAIRGQIEDFFDVKWQAVAAMSLVVALLIFSVYWRSTHGMNPQRGFNWGVGTAINVGVWLVLWKARDFWKR